MSQPAIRCIWLDIGDTVIEFNYHLTAKVLGRLSGKHPAWIESIIWDDYYTGRSPAYLFDLGRVSEKEFVALLRKILNIPAEIEDARILGAFNNYFYMGREMWQMLHFLKEKTECLLGVVSNNNELQWPHTLSLFPTLCLRGEREDGRDDIHEHGVMDFHVVSYKEGVIKPDRRIFERTFEESVRAQTRRLDIADLRPDECALFDNSRRNIAPARDFGVKAFPVDISAGYGGIRRDFESLGLEMPDPLWKPRHVGEYLAARICTRPAASWRQDHDAVE